MSKRKNGGGVPRRRVRFFRKVLSNKGFYNYDLFRIALVLPTKNSRNWKQKFRSLDGQAKIHIADMKRANEKHEKNLEEIKNR